jgi:hypothetical protein
MLRKRTLGKSAALSEFSNKVITMRRIPLFIYSTILILFINILLENDYFIGHERPGRMRRRQEHSARVCGGTIIRKPRLTCSFF